MPSSRISKHKKPIKSSSERRRALADIIDLCGREEMVRKCSYCRENKLSCRVHIRSGRCSQCVRRNSSDCDVRVTEEEWERLRKERRRLTAAVEEAREASNKALAKEMRLRKELDLLEEREAEAIAVEERDILEQEQEEGASRDTLVPVHDPENPGPDFALSPFTWTSLDGLPDSFWEPSVPPDFLLGPADGVSGSS